MKLLKNQNKIYFFIFLIFSLLNLTLEGIIEPDDILPLEISPTYLDQIGIKGTKFIFRFYLPNNLDKNGMPTIRGYGASNGQYIGISFNIDNDLFDITKIGHTCLMSQTDNNLNIPLISFNQEPSTPPKYKTIYCKINSSSNTNLMIPGHNYKLTITMIENMINNLKELISITIFTTSSTNQDADIFDIGTFNHINIIPPLNTAVPPLNHIANLEPMISSLNIEVETNFDFDVKITFNDWFSWDDYLICLSLPKKEVNTDNPIMKLLKPIEDPNIELPSGTIYTINLESNEDRKYIGFYLDGSLIKNIKNDILLMNFSGLKTKEAGLINDDTGNNNYIGIEIRYRNSYVICGSAKINFYITLGNVNFFVKHPETVDDNYKFDVFRGGAFQIEFTINTQKNLDKKYILIRQQESKNYQRVTFIASSCDFSNFNISSSNFNEIPKCHPIKNTNNFDGDSPDNFNGIFFYYPYIMKANTDYKLKVWMFFDECGPEPTELVYTGDRTKVEIKFYLEMYNNINKNAFGEKRIEQKNIFLNRISTPNGIICYNTYMGDKNYRNGYIFNKDSYSDDNLLLYREYFNWNIYQYNVNDPDDGNEILDDLFKSEEKKPKFIYSKSGNKLQEGTKLLLVNKITLDSGNNEKLSQFFPMGLKRLNIDRKINAIKGKFFMKLSKNFFSKTLDSEGNTEQCYVSWAFGSPSITENLPWKPKPKFYPKQKYNYITNSKKFFQNEPTALFNARIEIINDYSLFSKENEGWDDNKAEWSFGDDENLEDQISDEAPVSIFFGLADTCHYWTRLNQTIYSLYTPIEIIIGITGETKPYSRVMRFIKLFPEGGVWHDNIIDEGKDIFIRSNDFIVKNHFAYNKEENDEKSENEKGVCLLEIMNGILDSQKSLSSNFFLWIFMGSLLDTDYEQISSSYPVGNLKETAIAYGYSSQHSLHPKNFYAKPSIDQNSDINTPIYNLAISMSSLYQSATSGYLFYLGSLIVFYNKIKSNSFYDLSNDPLLIPYVCPYYHSKGEYDPYSLGIFPSFIAGFGSFNSMTDFGNKGFEKIIAKKINNIQLNVIMLSGIKIVHENNINLIHFYNTIKFINDYNNNLYTLDVWNSDDTNPCDNKYDSIDAFIIFFNSKITDLQNVNIYPQTNIPNQLKSLTKSIKRDYCFYAYGKEFCTGIYGLTKSDLLLTRNTPNSRDNTPYLSINLGFEIQQSLLICENSDKFCPTDLIAFWGVSSNHDMIHYVTNYKVDSFLLDYNIYRNYINNNPPTIELGQNMAFANDPAIFVKFTFNSPFKTAILSNTLLSFKIKDISYDAKCSVQSYDVNLPSMACDTNSGNIQCQLIDSSMKYNIFCYKLNYGTVGRFTFGDFKLNLPSENPYPGLGTLIFEDNNEYSTILINSDKSPINPIIYANYITIPYNLKSFTKLELKIDLKRPAHPGMKIEIDFESPNTDSFDEKTQCIFSLNKINSFSLSDIDMEEYWTEGNSIIYNCKITSSVTGVNLIYTVTAILEDKIYKAGEEFSKFAYIYIWPFKAIVLGDQYVYLSVSVNNNNILSSNNILRNQIYILSNIINTKENIFMSDLFSISVSSKILGDLSDYTFKFKFSTLSSTETISLAQIFFPKDINFECEECVKCYELPTYKMITCNFEDYNILNIYFSKEMKSEDSELKIIVTGIINPSSLSSSKLFLNYISMDYEGDKYAIYSSNYDLSQIAYIKPQYIERLRFFYVQQSISDHNPRKKSNYIFRVGFDYANNDYSSSSLPGLPINSLLYIYFPRDYHLYINENPTTVCSITYYYVNNNEEYFQIYPKILGRKMQITIGTAIDTTVKLKYMEIIINNIKNPDQIISNMDSLNKNKYTGYFKIVCLNKPDDDPGVSSTIQFYYTTGINSNTYRSDYINDDNLRTNEYNWYRGNLIETDYNNKNKLIVNVLYNEKTYNFIFLQPGRYTKVHFVTSSESEKISDFYLNPSSTLISFPSDSIFTTLENNYILPSLNGEPYEFYIGVSCSTNDGIYVVEPILSNTEKYIEAPSIIISVRQIEKAKIEFIQDNIGISPLNAKTRIYYYLSEINVDDLNIRWIEKNIITNNKNIDFDRITIPKKTYTNKDKKLSNVFSTITIKAGPGTDNSQYQYYYKSSNINKCYELTPDILLIRELPSITILNLDNTQNYKISDDLVVKNSENDGTLLSNEIKFDFSPPLLQPLFILCELYCQYKSPDEDEKLSYLNYKAMNDYISSVQQNYFRKYSNNYFSVSMSTGSLIFTNVIKGYQYNAKCLYQNTESETSSIQKNSYIYTSEGLHSTFPTKTRCNTFYFISPIEEDIQQKYINYCQYIIGKNLGYESGGCVICSDCSGKIISPGFNLYFPFNCQSEKCYDKSNSYLIEEMYRLSEEFNTNSKTSKYEFTICATSNRICSSQITEEKFNNAFNLFVNNVKTTENVNNLLDIDYNDIKYIIYNGFYQNSIFIEDKLKEDDISIEFITELDKNGNAIWKASYNSEVNFNILCFWRFKISTYQIPTLEEMTNCDEDDSFCGIFVANYGGHEYQIPEYKRSNVVVGEYTMYITCSHFVPSPIYFTTIKDVLTVEIKEESFSGKIKIKCIYLFLFLIILL